MKRGTATAVPRAGPAVQAFIAPVSFPKDARALAEHFAPDDDGEVITHLQALLNAHADKTEATWSAPRWAAEGDLLFFYHSKRAFPRIRELMGGLLTRSDGSMPTSDAEIRAHIATLEPFLQEIAPAVAEEYQLAEELRGTIFGCARVAGRAAADDSEEERERHKHWRSRVYATLRDVVIFERPLPVRDLAGAVTLSTTGGFTPLSPTAFAAVRDTLAAYELLPRYVARAVIGGEGFRGVTAANWRRRVCGPSAPRFLDETQLRTYLADFLLSELRDARTSLYEECSILTPLRGPRPDYFVRVEGIWLPVETKLSVLAEPRLVEQIARYLEVESFTPLRGAGRGTVRRVAGTDRCLVIDAAGLYVLDAEGYVAGEPGTPFISRRTLARLDAPSLRNQLARAIAAGSATTASRRQRGRSHAFSRPVSDTPVRR